MIRKDLKWHGHEVGTKLSHSSYNDEALQLGGGVGLFSLVEGSWSAADDALPAFADLRQNCTKACGGRVGVQPKGLAEVGEGSNGTGGEEHFEAVEGVLAVSAPVEDRVFPGQSIQGTGDGCEIFHISLVIPCETKERADFGGDFGRRNLSDGREERRVWQEAFFREPVAQITDLFGSKGAFLGPQLKVSVPQSLKDLPEPSEMFLPCRGKDDNIV